MRNRERVLRSGGRLSTWLLKRDSAASCHLNGSFAETTHQTMSPRPLLSCSCWPLRPSSCLHTFLLRTSTLSLVGPAQRARLLMMMPSTGPERTAITAIRGVSSPNAGDSFPCKQEEGLRCVPLPQRRSHASAVAVSSSTVAGVWFGGGGRRDGDGKQGRHVLAAQSNGRVWVPRAGPCRRQSQRDVIAMERAGADALSPRCTRIIVGSGRRHRCNSHGC